MKLLIDYTPRLISVRDFICQELGETRGRKYRNKSEWLLTKMTNFIILSAIR